ncbi:transmembrane domain-containing protein [Cedratvirus kamchatka]|uniref:Transmembrane domain-containing protein n=1 Tax=Cedratvirus kamchatka TaxID=2716914 RepID=A0A6G8MYM8_9VIRU|nr:transmembrane domain-containing protein [Cedratvirus kamchatka]
MGNNNSRDAYAKFNQDINNEIYQSLSTSCTATCDPNINNIDIIIIDTKVRGGIRFNQVCSAYAACTLPQSVDVNAERILTSSIEQATNTANSFLSYSPTADETEVDFQNRIRNSLTQILTSSCNATVRQSINNVLVYAVNSEIEGDIEFSQNGEASAVCSMNNAAKINLYNQTKAEIKQTTSSSNLTSILVLVGGVILVIVILSLAAFFLLRPTKE